MNNLRGPRGWRGFSLLGVGFVSEVVYLAATVRLPWWRYGSSLTNWRRILGEGWGAFVACLIGIGVLTVAYLWGWRVVRDEQRMRRIVWGFAILFAVTLLWLLPITSDLFVYLSKAHLFTDLGANPLLDAPLDLPADRLILAYLTRYAFKPSVYGPAWALLAAPGTLGRHDLVGGLLYLKGLAAFAYWGCAWLLERVLRKVRPASALEGLYLFTWNPLVLLMAVGDGHNDIAMMVGLLLAVWLLLRKRWALSFGALAASAWIKYVSVIFFPLFVIHIWWQLGTGRRWTALIRGGLAALGVSALMLAPFWRPELVGRVVERLIWPINWQGDASSLSVWALGVGSLLFVVIYTALVWRLARTSDSFSRLGRDQAFQVLMDLGFGVSLLAFLLGAVRSQPWHLIWPVTLAGLCSKRWAWPTVIGLSVVMLLTQVWVEWGTPGIEILSR